MGTRHHVLLVNFLGLDLLKDPPRTQSRNKLLQNKVFEESCAFFPCYRSSLHCGMWHGLECQVWGVKTMEC
jgi:hypothetical protein